MHFEEPGLTVYLQPAIQCVMASGEKWLVVYVASRQEKKVAKYLTGRGVENYLPLVSVLRQWSDRKKFVDFPMFPGYLFVRPDPAEMDMVITLPGVVNYLKFEKVPAVVTEKEIEIIRTIESSGYYAENIPMSEDYSLGEDIIVKEGPLRGQQGTLLRKDKEDVFLISFETIGQSLKVKIPYQMLGKAEN